MRYCFLFVFILGCADGFSIRNATQYPVELPSVTYEDSLHPDGLDADDFRDPPEISPFDATEMSEDAPTGIEIVPPEIFDVTSDVSEVQVSETDIAEVSTADHDSGTQNSCEATVDCGAHDDPCFEWMCDTASLVCVEIASSSCDDGNECTQEMCFEGECYYTPHDVFCDDGNECTVDDSCTNGICAGFGTCGCMTDEDCIDQEDGNVCNGTLVCDTNSTPSDCVVDSNTIVHCTDEDIQDCMFVSCTPQTGSCQEFQLTNGSFCSDHNVCTTTDQCSNGSCVGDVVTCDDGDVCTDDSCHPDVGCVYDPVEGSLCDDGNVNTITDICTLNGCVGVVAYHENFDDGEAQGWSFYGPDPPLPGLEVFIPDVGWGGDEANLFLAVRFLENVIIDIPTAVTLISPYIMVPNSSTPVVKFARWISPSCESAFLTQYGNEPEAQDMHCGNQGKSTSKIDMDTSVASHQILLHIVFNPGVHNAGDAFRFDSFMVQEVYSQ